jgi:CubicO group peptidase (beta-lactamase class C family)
MCEILITKNGKPTLEKTDGFTNSKKTKQLNNNSSFRLASISKQFTASGIMLLKEKESINENFYKTGF